MSLLLGVIADDLTGGMEAASMLVSLGVRAELVTRSELAAGSAAAGVQVLVVAQKIRVAPAGQAVAAATDAGRALRTEGARQLFYKYCATFDSTDAGNIGPISDSLLDLTGAQGTAYCPASAELRRSVFNGHLFYGRPLVSDSPKRFDPLTPMTDPDLTRVLARQTPHSVELLQHAFVRAGGAALVAEADRLFTAGARHLIADAIYDDDLAALAALCLDWPLMTGNSPILQHYPALWRASGLLSPTAGAPPLAQVDGGGVVLAGSCAERTHEQLAAFAAQRPVCVIDISTEPDPETAVIRALDWHATRDSDGPLAFATSAEPDDLGRAQSRLGRDGAAAFAEQVLAGLAERLFARGTRRFMIAGGETSGAIIERLGVGRMQIGRYEGPGIARGTGQAKVAGPAGAPVDGIAAFSLKSGKLGPVDMFLPTLEAMRRGEG